MARDEYQPTKRTVLIALIILLIVLSAGIGVISEVGITQLGDENTTPAEPAVTVTPPPSETPTETLTATSDTQPPDQTTDTETVTPSGISGSIDIDASAPRDVSNGAGHVVRLRSEISGTASWDEPVDSAVVVVSSWSPVDGWNEVRRTTVSPDSRSLTIEEAFGSTETRYLSGPRAEAFNNPHNATTLTRTGYIGVTVVLFEDGEEQGRLVDTTDYSFDVTNVGRAKETDVETANETEAGTATETNAGSADVTVDLSQTASQTGGTASDNLAPGSTGYRSITLENDGSESGTLRVFLTNVTGSENGFADPEAAVDDDQESELLDVLQIRIAVVDDGDRTYLLGGPDEYAPLTRSTLGDSSGEVGVVPLPSGERRAVVVEWSVPKSVGKEIMTDTVDWDLKFVLESDGSND